MTPSENPALLRAALNLSGNGILLFDCLRTATGSIQDFRLVLANREAEAMTGMSEQTMLNRTATELFPGSLPTNVWQHARRVVETGETYETEFSYRLTDSAEVGWYTLTLQKHGDGLAASFANITDLKRYEQNLQKSIESLQHSNQSLERFAYVVSHDLQEPLRKIQQFGEVLRAQTDGALSQESLEMIRRMQSAAGRMGVLIQDLLTFSRLSTQKQPFSPVNLQEIMDDVLVDLETAVYEKQAVVDITSMPIVLGDALQLRQVFQNLLSNALKFVKSTEKVRVNSGAVPHVRVDCEQLLGHDIRPLPGQAVAETDLGRSFYAISIIDNGIGFDEKYLGRIFTVFQRLHTRSEYPGTGIGLAIVQKVVENHQGYIGAHSRPGQGATFRVYLPVPEFSVADALRVAL